VSLDRPAAMSSSPLEHASGSVSLLTSLNVHPIKDVLRAG